MSAESLLALALAVAIQLGGLAYWAGRVSARLEALERRVDRLFTNPPRPPAAPSSAPARLAA